MTAGSGDLLADRRLAWAQAALDDGDPLGAADLARQALELQPSFAPAHFLLGRAEAELGHRDAAVGAFRQALAADPDDTLGAAIDLARLAAADPLGAVSTGYVRALFDEYAVRFDRHLTRSLHYRGPALLHDAVRRAASLRLRPFAFGTALDLGCGTGLAGEAFRPECRVLSGVDLSPAMVEKARRKNLYDELAVADLAGWMAARPDGAADLVLAADVFVYLGDLGRVFSETARVLAADGLFAFTVQAHGGQGVVLGADARFAHAEPYLRDSAAAVGLDVCLLERCVTREDRGEPVPGLLAVMSR